MAWIEVHQSLPRHRKIVSAGHLLDVPRMSIIGHMICLWTWALDNAQSGELTGIPSPVIATGAEWTGDPDAFVDALVQVGFLDRDLDRLQIHNWKDYAGKLIARRTSDRDRKRAQRMSPGNPEDVPRKSAPTVPYRTLPYSTKDYIQTLRAIPRWQEKGEPHIETLVKWAEKKAIAEDVLERAAIGLAKATTKTLLGYDNLARAFQDRINKGYDDPANQRSPNGTHWQGNEAASGPSQEDLTEYVQEFERLERLKPGDPPD